MYENSTWMAPRNRSGKLKPAHAFGVDSRKSFKVQFTIG
jgi:hypothetical protein